MYHKFIYLLQLLNYNNLHFTVSTHNKMVLSESDTDSDVLFEHRKSKNGSHIDISYLIIFYLNFIKFQK